MRRGDRSRIKSESKRHRNVAHIWADKQVLRFFRKSFEKIEYKNLRSVYLAVCEIDSDFGECSEIGSFVNTVASYSGMDKTNCRKYLQALRAMQLIEYTQTNEGGVFGKTVLKLYKWEHPMQEEVHLAKAIMSDTDGTSGSKTNLPLADLSVNGGPLADLSVNGNKNKNNNTKVLLSNIYPPTPLNKFDIFIRMFPISAQRNPEFRESLERFCLHREYMKRKLTITTMKRIAKKLLKCPIDISIDAINLSIRKGWINVFPESVRGRTQAKWRQERTPEDIIRGADLQSVESFVRTCYEPASAILGAGYDKANLAENMIGLVKWFDRVKWKPRENLMSIDAPIANLIPTSNSLVASYVGWLESQSWINQITPSMFTENSRTFLQFFSWKQTKVGIDFIKGKDL